MILPNSGVAKKNWWLLYTTLLEYHFAAQILCSYIHIGDSEERERERERERELSPFYVLRVFGCIAF